MPFMMAQRPMLTLAPMALRSVHSRGYNNYDDTVTMQFHEINLALMNARNTQNIAYLYQRWGPDIMTPEQIAFGFRSVAMHKLEKSPEFWNIILPIVKKQMTTLDRQTVRSLLMSIEAASAMYLQDNEFWEIVEQKVVDEGLHRYFSLEEMSELLCHLGRVGRGSDDMVEIIEKYFIKHRKGLTERTIANAKVGFAAVNKGSEILQRVLEDPNTELPALE